MAAMRAIWSETKPAYHGRFVSFADVQAYPHPLQQPYPPIVVGGRSPAALRRAVEQANGWFGWALDLDETSRAIADLREVAKRSMRPEKLGELEISIAPRVPNRQDNSSAICRAWGSPAHSHSTKECRYSGAGAVHRLRRQYACWAGIDNCEVEALVSSPGKIE